MDLKIKEEKILTNKKLLENSKQILYNPSTTSINFSKKENKNIMDKITKIINDNEIREKYESCYIASNHKFLQSYNKSSNSKGRKILKFKINKIVF